MVKHPGFPLQVSHNHHLRTMDSMDSMDHPPKWRTLAKPTPPTPYAFKISFQKISIAPKSPGVDTWNMWNMWNMWKLPSLMFPSFSTLLPGT